MAKRSTGGGSARSSRSRKRRPKKQAGKAPAKRRGGNPKGKGHRSSTTWKAGQSGNYKGRPRSGEALSDIAIAKMNIKDARRADGTKLKRKDALVEMLYSKAIKDRDMTAFRELREMLSHAGPPIDAPQSTEAAVYQGVLALFRKVADKHPELKQELIDGLAETRTHT